MAPTWQRRSEIIDSPFQCFEIRHDDPAHSQTTQPFAQQKTIRQATATIQQLLRIPIFSVQ
jgi:hypothetical protein